MMRSTLILAIVFLALGGAATAQGPQRHASPGASGTGGGTQGNSTSSSGTVTVKGKSVDVADMHRRVAKYATEHGKPRERLGERSHAPVGLAAATLKTRNSEVLARAASESGAVTGPAGSKSREAQAHTPCPNRPPDIASTEGAVQPGGVVFVKGSCFGSQHGEVRMLGAFPSGFVRLDVNIWGDQGVAVTIPPALSGVLDQRAELQVTTADGRHSNNHSVAFTAQRTTMQVPANLLHNTACANLASDCDNAAANHFAMGGTSDETPSFGLTRGADSWQVKVGNGWAITTLDLGTSFGQFTVSGFDQGPPDYVAFSVNWTAKTSVQTTTRDCGVCVSDSTWTEIAAYTPLVNVIGPVGVSPDPAVKPAFSETPAGTSRGPAAGARVPTQGGATKPK